MANIVYHIHDLPSYSKNASELKKFEESTVDFGGKFLPINVSVKIFSYCSYQISIYSQFVCKNWFERLNWKKLSKDVGLHIEPPALSIAKKIYDLQSIHSKKDLDQNGKINVHDLRLLEEQLKNLEFKSLSYYQTLDCYHQKAKKCEDVYRALKKAFEANFNLRKIGLLSPSWHELELLADRLYKEMDDLSCWQIIVEGKLAEGEVSESIKMLETKYLEISENNSLHIYISEVAFSIAKFYCLECNDYKQGYEFFKKYFCAFSKISHNFFKLLFDLAARAKDFAFIENAIDELGYFESYTIVKLIKKLTYCKYDSEAKRLLKKYSKTIDEALFFYHIMIAKYLIKICVTLGELDKAWNFAEATHMKSAWRILSEECEAKNYVDLAKKAVEEKNHPKYKKQF